MHGLDVCNKQLADSDRDRAPGTAAIKRNIENLAPALDAIALDLDPDLDQGLGGTVTAILLQRKKRHAATVVAGVEAVAALRAAATAATARVVWMVDLAAASTISVSTPELDPARTRARAPENPKVNAIAADLVHPPATRTIPGAPLQEKN